MDNLIVYNLTDLGFFLLAALFEWPLFLVAALVVIYEGKLDHRYWVLSTSLVWIFALSLKYLTQQQTAPIVATMLPSLMGLFLMIVFAPKVDTELGSKKSWQWWSKRTGQNFGILLSLTVCFGILVSWIHGENLVVSSKRYLGVFHQMLKQEVD